MEKMNSPKGIKSRRKGFTLGETLISLLIIAILSVVSVPAFKKLKETREAGVDKNSWAAVYENDELVVYKNGTAVTYATSPADFVDANTPKFIPPSGVNKFNVTVIGGGGGGAAGVSTPGVSKKYFAGTNAEEYKFIPPYDGLYRIIAIGGGGGAGGGAPLCSGVDGHSGGGVFAIAKLEKEDVLAVIVGPGGTRGLGENWGDFGLEMLPKVLINAAIWAAASYLVPMIAPALSEALTWTSIEHFASTEFIRSGLTKVTHKITIYWIEEWAIEAALYTTTAALGQVMSQMLTPSNDWNDGGGHGISTVILGGGDMSAPDKVKVNIVAGGGAGGQWRRKKFRGLKFQCTKKSRNDFMDKDFENLVIGTGIQSSYSLPPNKKSRYFCVDKNGDLLVGERNQVCTKIATNMDGGLSQATTFGNGGAQRGQERSGNRGSDGYAEITEISAYGGGAGKAGSVSVHTFERSPVDTTCEGDTCYVAITVGKGGKGGVPASDGSGITAREQRGADGGYSSFGEKVIAGGGEGGELRVVLAKQYKDGNKEFFKSKGEDGGITPLPLSIIKKAGLSGVRNEKFLGIEEQQGEGVTEDIKGIPGLGGAGGGASADMLSTDNSSYAGGNGESGMVLVTW